MSLYTQTPLGPLAVPSSADTLVLVAAGPQTLEVLRAAGLGTLALERPEYLVAALDFAATDRELCELSVGCFAVGHAVADAAFAAAERPWGLGALVLVPDDVEVSDELLERVRVKTLIFGEDPLTSRIARRVHEYVEVRPTADAVEVARWACAWLKRNLGAAQRETHGVA